MVRGLWTAASGMVAQQLNVDTISNNLANVNTTGYKKESTNFKSLLYANLEGPEIPNIQAPASMQVGHGVRALANSRNYTGGILQATTNATDLALEGKGFFAIQKGEQETYTRDGSFRIALTDETSYALVTADGDPVLSTEDESIIIGTDVPIDKVIFGKDGSLYYMDPDTKMRVDIAKIKIVQFSNTEGLEAIGSNLFVQTPASGEALLEGEAEGLKLSNVVSGYLEGSNVQVAEEMVKLIVAQRAYELNSTAIKAVDTMMQQANELKRS